MFNWLFTKEHRERKAKRTEAVNEQAKTYPGGSFNFGRGKHTINLTKDSFIVNGIKLEPGSPEYIKARTEFDKDMEKFSNDMEKLSEHMSNMFKDF